MIWWWNLSKNILWWPTILLLGSTKGGNQRDRYRHHFILPLTVRECYACDHKQNVGGDCSYVIVSWSFAVNQLRRKLVAGMMSPALLFHRLPYLASARLNLAVVVPPLTPLETTGRLQQSDRVCKISVHVQPSGPHCARWCILCRLLRTSSPCQLPG